MGDSTGPNYGSGGLTVNEFKPVLPIIILINSVVIKKCAWAVVLAPIGGKKQANR